MLIPFEKIRKTYQFLNRNDGSLRFKVLRAGFWISISSLTLNILGFSKNIILARLLTPEIFGLMGICLMVMRGIEIFTETGFATALIQRQGDIEKEKETAFSLTIIRGFFLAIILFCISSFVAGYYERPELKALMQALAIVLIIKGLKNIHLVSKVKELDFQKIVYLQNITTLSNFLLVVALAYYLRSVWALVWGQILVTILETMYSYILIPGRFKPGFDTKIAKSLFGYGKYITGSTIVLFLASEIDNAFVGKIIGVEMLGYYVVAYFLANIPATHIAKVASGVLMPAYSKIQNDLPALRQAYLKIFKLLATVTIPAACGIAFLAPEIINLVYGDKWLRAIEPLEILCIFGGCRSLLVIYGYLFNAIGKPEINLYLALFRLILSATLLYPFTVVFGLVGAAAAVTIPIALQLGLNIHVLQKTIQIHYKNMCLIIGKILINTSLMTLFIITAKHVIPINTALHLAGIILVSMAIYMLLNLNYAKSTIKEFM